MMGSVTEEGRKVKVVVLLSLSTLVHKKLIYHCPTPTLNLLSFENVYVKVHPFKCKFCCGGKIESQVSSNMAVTNRGKITPGFHV